jgi:AcrR family transcriptional regulator
MELVAQANLRRGSYHHGDLANALTTAATEMARQGGPEAVVLREAARQVGVSATAAYRHFAGHGDLIHEVKERCLAALAERMRAEVEAGDPAPDRRAEALRRLRAIGWGYVRFALAEPGLFRTACFRAESPRENPLGMIGSPAFAMLTQTLDDLTELGLIDPERRPYLEVVAWSSAHGLATLIVDGPLGAIPEDQRDAAVARTLDTVIAGICAGAALDA